MYLIIDNTELTQGLEMVSSDKVTYRACRSSEKRLVQSLPKFPGPEGAPLPKKTSTSHVVLGCEILVTNTHSVSSHGYPGKRDLSNTLIPNQPLGNSGV